MEGAKTWAASSEGGGQIFSARDFQICTAPPPAVNNDRSLTIESLDFNYDGPRNVYWVLFLDQNFMNCSHYRAKSYGETYFIFNLGQFVTIGKGLSRVLLLEPTSETRVSIYSHMKVLCLSNVKLQKSYLIQHCQCLQLEYTGL